LAASAALVAGSASAATYTTNLNLGTGPTGTLYEPDVFVTLIPAGTLPAGSILMSVGINATIQSSDNSNWASELMVAVDPTPESPGGDDLLEIGPDPAQEGGLLTYGSAQNAFWANGYTAPVSAVTDTRAFPANWSTPVDLSTAALCVANSYNNHGPAGTGGHWWGTLTVTYVDRRPSWPLVSRAMQPPSTR
jgi:hypothetical protein